jgi:hypothetical protein
MEHRDTQRVQRKGHGVGRRVGDTRIAGYPKRREGQVTVEYANKVAKYHKMIKALFPQKYLRIDEGSHVTCPDGVSGKIVTYHYHPTTDAFYIEVAVGGYIRTYTDESLLTRKEINA